MYITGIIGRYLFALSIAGLGVIQMTTANFPSAFLPVSSSLPLRSFFVYFTGIVFLISGILIATDTLARIAAVVTGCIFLLLLCTLHLPKLFANFYDPTAWTITFETLALCCGLLIVTDTLSADSTKKYNSVLLPIVKVAYYMFAVTLVIFGIQHIMYADFILTLIPSWIPAARFWSVLVQIGFLATALSIFLHVQVRLATMSTAVMFLCWVIFLHAPRVAMKPGTEPEWTSLCIAMAMSGILFLFPRFFNRKLNLVAQTVQI